MEFPYDGHNYRAGKIDAMKQFHIVRRLSPVLGHVLTPEILDRLKNKAGSGPDQNAGLDFVASMFEPFAQAISELTDSNAEFVLTTCLRACTREMEGGRGWTQVAASNGKLMFEEIGLAGMLFIAFKVLEVNLADFFSALRANFSAPETPLQTV